MPINLIIMINLRNPLCDQQHKIIHLIINDKKG